jgi:eukaryotic-like serine/threonine-protein kinase
MPPSPGTLIGEKFRVVRMLGKGGMGVVYEVVHELTKHHRALKLLHGDVAADHPDLVRRFLREASVAGTLGDPRIVETFDAGKLPSGEPYLVMELLEGETLAARIEREGPQFPLRDAIAIAREVAGAMTSAHGKGITHRDLKPENVFLVKGAVKVLDFGISKFAPDPSSDAAATQEGVARGTPYYMAPEQLRAQKDLDGRVDVYAIGLLLYETITGRRPFDAPTMSALIVKISEGDAVPLTTFRSGVPAALASLVARAMHRDREQRVQTAAELSELLSAIRLNDVDVLAATAVADEVSFAATAPAISSPRRSRWLIALLVIPLAAATWWWIPKRTPVTNAPTIVASPTAPAVASPPPPAIASSVVAPSSSPPPEKPPPPPPPPKSKHSSAGLTPNPL